MSSLEGNQFWKLRTIHGRSRLFGDAKLLLEEAYTYFDWCDNNPWQKTELVKYKGEATQSEVPLGRMYSMAGLCTYLGVTGSYFRTAKRELSDKVERKTATDDELNLLDAIELIEQAIQTQQLEGAAVGVFASNLVSRLNGLADNQNVINTQPTVNVSVRDEDTVKDMAKLDSVL